MVRQMKTEKKALFMHAAKQTAGTRPKRASPSPRRRGEFPMCCCISALARDAKQRKSIRIIEQEWWFPIFMRLTIKNTCCNRPMVQRYQSVSKSCPSVSQLTKCSHKIMMKRWNTISSKCFCSTLAASNFSSIFSTISSVGFSPTSIFFRFVDVSSSESSDDDSARDNLSFASDNSVPIPFGGRIWFSFSLARIRQSKRTQFDDVFVHLLDGQVKNFP